MRRFIISCFCLFLIYGCDQVRFIPIQGENKKVVRMNCGRHLELTLTTALIGRRGLRYEIKIIDAMKGVVLSNNVIISTEDKAVHCTIYHGNNKISDDSLDLERVRNLVYFFELPSDSVSTVTISGNKFLVAGVDTCSFGPVSTSIRK